jgi:glycogen phosphorylase
VLGIGGTKLLDEMGYEPEVYHFNEAHALSGAFYLYKKLGNKLSEVKKRLVFTTHTPEEAGNEKHDINFLDKLSFFAGLTLAEVRKITGITDSVFNHSLAALRMSRKANAVSKLHGDVSRQMWGGYDGICEITHVTNAQNALYWADSQLNEAAVGNDLEGLDSRKKAIKKPLFDTVAEQCGKIFDPEVLTIVWTRRFAAYKRPNLLTINQERFDRLMKNTKYPVQFVWAGKPYPFDNGAVQMFNELYYLSHLYPNMAVLTGHELALSKQLKHGADIWLNTPIVTREASGTSGMTAAMNGALNLSTYDGWVCEFSEHGKNSFIVPVADNSNRDGQDIDSLFTVLEEEILPLYYQNKKGWNQVVQTSMTEVNGFFNSDRMAAEYYEKMY